MTAGAPATDGATTRRRRRLPMFTEVIIAPDATDEAILIVGAKKNLRLLLAGACLEARVEARDEHVELHLVVERRVRGERPDHWHSQNPRLPKPLHPALEQVDLGLTTAEVTAVSTFYSMYRRKPAGKKHIRVCRTLSCALNGAELPGYAARRAELGAAEVSKRFLVAAGAAVLCVDTGYVPEPITSPAELGDLAGAAAHEIVRLERVAEDVAAAGVGADGFADAVRSSAGEPRDRRRRARARRRA